MDNMRTARRSRRPRETQQLGASFLGQPPLRNHLKPIEPLSQDQLMAIHEASLRLLEEIGIEFMGKAARQKFREAGAGVDEDTGQVRIPRELITEALKTAPSSFVLTPRNPARRLHIGENHISFSLVAGPPNIHDCVNGRRSGNYQDYISLIKLAQSFDIIHCLGNQPTAPIELPARTRHLDCYLANVTYADRVYHCSAIGRNRALDGIDVMAISRGLTREQVADDPGVLTVISVNSPRRFDESMSDGLMAMSEWGQAVVVTPFTLMGAMTPVTIAAALTQQNAEALAGIVLTQLVRPGAPVVYGAFTSNVDMRSGAPAFGTPENARATMAAGQLARLYNLPYRASNSSASNAVDAQAAYESEMSIWSAVMGHANLVYHGAGWMEGGLTASFEKIILDVEMLQMMANVIKPIDVTPEEIEDGLKAIAAVPTGGHFFGAEHTLARYETAFYQPLVSNWQNYENWELAGARDATQRATAIWQKALDLYEAPAMDPAISEALAEFVARRKEELKDVDH
ncbi:trimethylamine methyltransferase family protein [Dongia soli]|uniref:Methyltransferase n=2 Tax=Dongia soli TaxID=600628 RepID=A0ABU5EDF0_9PROT|nr:trimethylamine methyltransferase family protein [Dongia soli]MDY0884398.1 trimethylamine methyltransferase family protein [Dongia soli]